MAQKEVFSKLFIEKNLHKLNPHHTCCNILPPQTLFVWHIQPWHDCSVVITGQGHDLWMYLEFETFSMHTKFTLFEEGRPLIFLNGFGNSPKLPHCWRYNVQHDTATALENCCPSLDFHLHTTHGSYPTLFASIFSYYQGNSMFCLFYMWFHNE